MSLIGLRLSMARVLALSARFLDASPSKAPPICGVLLGLQVVEHLDATDFILAHGTEALGFANGNGIWPVILEELEQLLERSLDRGIPMIIANPDHVTVEARDLCIMLGLLGIKYEQMGGHVRWMGKPDQVIYEAAKEMLGVDARECIAVGNPWSIDTRPSATSFNVVNADKDKVEVSFIRPFNPLNSWKMVPLNIDKRFVLLRGSSGFYTYAIYERPSGWPDFNLNQTRVTFKLRKDRFHYMAIADNKQRFMPSPDDRMPDKCQILAYPEAVLLTRPGNPNLQGEIDDKYQYSCDNRENRVHGWISFNPMVGFWVITPSDEFRNGGPIKQNLTSHVGPTSLAMFHSAHYAGDELCPKFRFGEPWQKVFGPVFIYLNYASKETHPFSMWLDAKSQMLKEVQNWPYWWPASPFFKKKIERGCIFGKLLVQDRYATKKIHPASFAFLGLAAPGEKGSWQIESKRYQFWSQADVDGCFKIDNICPGDYNLYGWVPGVLGDYMNEDSISIYPGCKLEVGALIYEPPRDGPTLWEIGIPDRTASEFYIPDPNRDFINKLFLNHPERFRQYGLWERYSKIFNDNDLIYIVGSTDWRRDWYFAHTCRIEKDGTFHPATWQVKFQLEGVKRDGIYKLRLSIASSTNAAIQIRFNNANIYKPHFDTMQFGKDNAIARHGIHGLYHLFNIDVSGSWLVEGENILYLTQRKATSPFTGVMYDYLRLEEPPL